jgi:hypothetical protein
VVRRTIAPAHREELKMSKQKSGPSAKAALSGSKPKRAKGSQRRAFSKQMRVVGLLSRPHGVTIAAIMRSTGWQQHSVRGFLAGVVRKKLGLKLTSEKGDGPRVYRIVSGTGKATIAPSAS